MTEEDRILFNDKEFYLLLSKKTKKAYITEDYISYCFESTNAAEAWLNSFSDSELKDPEIIEQKLLLSDFFCRGAEKIIVVFRNGEQREVKLEAEDFPPGNYNIDSCRAFTLAFQTNKKKYLRSLLSLLVYIPVSTPQRKKGFYPQIEYMGGVTSLASYFLVFTNLEEYSKWAKKVEANTGALCIPLYAINRIRKKAPVLINPMSEKFVLTDELMRMVSN